MNISGITNEEADLFGRFLAELREGDPVRNLREGQIGEDARIEGPFGSRVLVYADYVASGRALAQVEELILRHVLPYYANSHTEASYCGMTMTRLRNRARSVIAQCLGADERHAVIFCGSGATAGLNKLVHLLGIAQKVSHGERPLVLVGPYEHHSNLLPWRESGAEVIEIEEAEEGGPDLAQIEAHLLENASTRLCVGAFSAASNVTGILTDIPAVTRLLKRHGARVVWDYAGGGPYLPVSVRPAPDCEIDAIVLSPHKFIGGPGASGILVIRRECVSSSRPSAPGGGTVAFVSPWGHDYSSRVESREEAGTPNVIGDLRAALAFLAKEAIGQDFLDIRHHELNQRALQRWCIHPAIELLGPDRPQRLPIFAFRIRDLIRGGYLHHQLFTRMLSDQYGIQARGGCACAGCYGHRLLGISREESERYRASIAAGIEIEKPGWVRLNFSALMTDEKVDFILDSVSELALSPHPLADRYEMDKQTARFRAASDHAAT